MAGETRARGSRKRTNRIILCAGKGEEHVELWEPAQSGIHVASYLTDLLPKAQLKRKLHESFISHEHACEWPLFAMPQVTSVEGDILSKRFQRQQARRGLFRNREAQSTATQAPQSPATTAHAFATSFVKAYSASRTMLPKLLTR